jgi:hypothetical protein
MGPFLPVLCKHIAELTKVMSGIKLSAVQGDFVLKQENGPGNATASVLYGG